MKYECGQVITLIVVFSRQPNHKYHLLYYLLNKLVTERSRS